MFSKNSLRFAFYSILPLAPDFISRFTCILQAAGMGKMRLRAYESWHMQSIFCVGVLDKYLYSQMFAYKQVSAS